MCKNKAVAVGKCVKCSKTLLQDALTDKINKINNYKISINDSDYFAGFEIKRDELHKILVEKYNIYSSYNHIYRGVGKFY